MIMKNLVQVLQLHDAKFIAIGLNQCINKQNKVCWSIQAVSQDYPKNSIVQKDEGLWKALVDIEGEESQYTI